MKNKDLTTLLFVLCMICSISLHAQTETFDIATFTPPKDFKKDVKPGVITYSHVNTKNGAYCIINIFASSKSSGDEEKDFKAEWNALVATPFKADPNPTTETNEAEGWKVIMAVTQAKFEEAEVVIILSVFSGHGKKFSIRTSLNEQSYSTQVDELFASMQLDENASPANNSTVNTTTSMAESNPTTASYGNMMYTTPAGWSEQKYSDGVIIKPADLPQGEFLSIQILQPLTMSGSIEQALAHSYDEAATMYKGSKMHFAGGANYEKKEAKTSFRGWEYIRGTGGIKIENGTPYPSEFQLTLIVIKINNRFERVAILQMKKSCGGLQYYPADRQLYSNAIENFLFSIHFSDGGNALVENGSIIGSGITGVWEGISMRTGAPTTSSPAGMHYKTFSVIFLSNGQAYFGTKFPTGGLNNLDTRIEAENTRRDWGTYTFNNGRGVLRLPYGDLPMRMENNKFIITANNTDHAFHKLNSVDGAKFNGTYVMAQHYGRTPVITFTSDGKFTDKGAIHALYHEHDYCNIPGIADGSGTYVVKDYSVIFTYNDGRKISVAFLGTGNDINNHSPSSIRMGFNEDELRRQ